MHRTVITLVAAVALLGCTTGRDRTTGTTAGSTTMGAAGQVSEPQLQEYIELRRQLASQNPEMERAFESGDLSGQRDRLQAALSGSSMSVDQFMQVHQQVQQDPELRSRVEARLGASGGTGIGPTGSGVPSGESTTTPGWRGAPSDTTPPTTSGGAGASGAQPSASPQ